MRTQERAFPPRKRESKEEFLARLQRTAKRIAKTSVNKWVGNMQTRCQRLYAARGGHFEEGGL